MPLHYTADNPYISPRENVATLKTISPHEPPPPVHLGVLRGTFSQMQSRGWAWGMAPKVAGAEGGSLHCARTACYF